MPPNALTLSLHSDLLPKPPSQLVDVFSNHVNAPLNRRLLETDFRYCLRLPRILRHPSYLGFGCEDATFARRHARRCEFVSLSPRKHVGQCADEERPPGQELPVAQIDRRGADPDQ